MTFNYLEKSQQAAASTTKKVSKKGSASATRQMLADRAAQLEAEKEATGRPAIWEDVYKKMRCPDRFCPHRPHCWQDGGKHYKLDTRQLQSLVMHVQRGGVVDSHNDVPEEIRRQLYDLERQHLERRHKSTDKSAAKPPSIIIKNVIPGSLYRSLAQVRVAPKVRRLVIPGLCDTAVEEYSDWQRGRVGREHLKQGIRDARDIISAGPRLRLCADPRESRLGSLVTGGCEARYCAAFRFVREIEYWVTQCKGYDAPPHTEAAEDLYASS